MVVWCFMNEIYDWDKLFMIAKRAILFYMRNKRRYVPDCGDKKRATFVTLEKGKELRGCIGSIFPHTCLERDVASNAINAAFFDPRFYPLKENELDSLYVSISILSPMQLFEGKVEEWLSFISSKKPGVYIRSSLGSSTFLPEVWKQIPDAKDFMEALSLKAGLHRDAWRNMDKYYYFTISKGKKFSSIEI